MEYIEIELVRAWNYRDIGSRLTPPVGQAELMIQTGIAKRVTPEEPQEREMAMTAETATDARAETAETATMGHLRRRRRRR